MVQSRKFSVEAKENFYLRDGKLSNPVQRNSYIESEMFDRPSSTFIARQTATQDDNSDHLMM